MELLVEFAHSKTRRNNFATVSQFNAMAAAQQKSGEKRELYRSLFLYPADELRHHLKINNGHIAQYQGTIVPSHVMIDVDGTDHSARALKRKVEEINTKLHGALGIPPECAQYFFSGRGIHVMLHRDLFKLQASPTLHKIVAGAVHEILMGYQGFDNIYARSQLFRWPNTWNESAGCFKIPLTYEEVCRFDIDEIQELAKQPRLDYDYSRWQESGDLFDLSGYILQVEDKQAREETLAALTGQPVKEASPMALNRKKLTCIHSIIDRGPAEGSRHHDIGAISCAMARQGVHLQVTSTFLQAWIRQADGKLNDNREKYTNDYVAEQVSYWYKGGYRPSCTGDNPYSKQMQKHCDPECMFFIKKNLNHGMLTTDESFAKLEKRMAQEENGEFINATQIFSPGDTSMQQLLIFNGTLVTVMGPTSVGKTAFMLWFALQIRMGIGYLSLEMAYATMLKRLAMQALNCTADGLRLLYRQYKPQVQEAIRHIHITTEPMNVAEIQDMMDSMGHTIAVIDHIGLMKTFSNDERKRTIEVSRGLRQLVVNRETIIFMLSHISRSDARLNVVDLYSAKESGSVENDSHIVISVTEHPTFPNVRVIKILKNTDGPRGMEYHLEFKMDTGVFVPIPTARLKPKEIT